MRTERQHRDRGRSFGQAAEQYHRHRPSYPAEAVDWLLADNAHRVLDLAAGTGKLTTRLVEAGLDVVAVEPLDTMRAQLTTALPGVDARPGTAENIPLPDHDVDAVLVAQAWHWFDQHRALAEIARVLRPGGTLGLIWNLVDMSVDWVRQVEELADEPHQDEDEPPGPLATHPDFRGWEEARFAHGQHLDAAGLAALYGSHSAALVRPEPARRALLDRIEALARTHPDLAGRDRFVLPYLTLCVRARRA